MDGLCNVTDPIVIKTWDKDALSAIVALKKVLTDPKRVNKLTDVIIPFYRNSSLMFSSLTHAGWLEQLIVLLSTYRDRPNGIRLHLEVDHRQWYEQNKKWSGKHVEQYDLTTNAPMYCLPKTIGDVLSAVYKRTLFDSTAVVFMRTDGTVSVATLPTPWAEVAVPALYSSVSDFLTDHNAHVKFCTEIDGVYKWGIGSTDPDNPISWQIDVRKYLHHSTQKQPGSWINPAEYIRKPR